MNEYSYLRTSQKNLWKDECRRYAACLGIGILTLAGLGFLANIVSHMFF